MDIEASELVDFDKPSKVKIAIVGTQVWNKKGSKYSPSEYLAFSPEKISGTVPLEGLKLYLESFDGLIIGHNIFDFDLRVLSSLFDVKKLSPKIVDTMAVLFARNDSCHFGLALGNLGKKNLNKSKIESGKKIPHLWKMGKYKQVIKYNQRDLELTKEIWEYMIKNEGLEIRYDYHPEGGTHVYADLTSGDLQILTGKKKQFSSNTLADFYRSGKKLLPYKPFVSPFQKYREAQELMEDQAPFDPDTVYRWLFCSDCNATSFYRASIHPGFADREMAKCGDCEKDLREVRADMGLDHIATLPIDFGEGASQGIIPDPIKKVVRKHFASQAKFIKLFRDAKGCSVCGGSFDEDRRVSL